MKNVSKKDVKKLIKFINYIGKLCIKIGLTNISIEKCVDKAFKKFVPVTINNIQINEINKRTLLIMFNSIADNIPYNLVEFIRLSTASGNSIKQTLKNVKTIPSDDAINDFINLLVDTENSIKKEEEENKFDFSDKIIGDVVFISSASLTNLLIPAYSSKNKVFKIKYNNKLAFRKNEKAYVIEEDCGLKYDCGNCNSKHTANSKIAFADKTEYYIDSAALKHYKHIKNEK